MRLAFVVVSGALVAGCGSSADDGAATVGTGSSGVGGSTGAGGAGPTGPIAGRVTRYSYGFDLASAHARSKVEVAVDAPGDCYAISSEIPASAVTWNGAPAMATLEGGKLTACGDSVAAKSTLALGAEADVPSDTFFNLDVGFSRHKDMVGGQFSYLLSWVGGCDRFGPCDDDPARLAAFHFEVSHGANDVVLCPGALSAGATATSCDLAGTLAPTYSAFAIAADAKWKRSKFVSAGGVDLVFYEVPGGKIAASLDPASVGEFFPWLTSLLGPFPYGGELRFAGAPTVWLGFEHPANIVLLEDLPSIKVAYQNPTMHVVMHETVHQWAGDRTTIAGAADFVWKEATAEYLSYVFEDEHRPPAEAAASLAYWDAIALQAKHFPRPTDVPAPAVQTFYGDVYGPGPMVLYVQLESLFGRTAVLAGIKSFLAEPGARAVSDLQAALSAATGQDLGPYFGAWVFGAGAPEWPTFALSTEQAAGQVKVTLTQQNASKKLYGCRVEVDVAGASKTATAVIDFGAAPSSASASATVPLAEPLVSTAVDPRHRVVAKIAGSPAAVAEPLVRVWPL